MNENPSENDCDIEMFLDGTNIFWFKDGKRVSLEMPPSLPQARKDKHIAYVKAKMDERNGTNTP